MFEKARPLKLIELAGWGGGPGVTFAVVFRGLISVTRDEATGLLCGVCRGEVETEEWVAKQLGGTSKTKKAGFQSREQTVWVIPDKTTFFFHPSHVRVMG